MKIRFFRLFFTAVAIAAAFSVNSLATDYGRYQVNAHPYAHGDLSDTKAPAGYKPFYISYMGRHGSRYLTGDEHPKEVLKVLKKAEEKGILSQSGREVMSIMDTMLRINNKNYGYLSPTGHAELDLIGCRMTSRFSPVFRNKDRQVVNAFSNVVPRCINTMADVCCAIQRNCPSVRVNLNTNENVRYSVISNKSSEDSKIYHKSKDKAIDSLEVILPYPQDLMNTLFTDPEAAKEICKPVSFAKHLFYCAAYSEVMGLPKDLVFNYFSDKDLYSYFVLKNSDVYISYGPAKEGLGRILNGVHCILDGVLKDADAALEGNDHCADMRFGHDSGTIPYAALLGIEGVSKETSVLNLDHGWNSSVHMCMACNVQIVFYKNSGNDVLVKVLFNEAESRIDGLEPVYGPYYKWDDFKKHMQSKLN